MTLADVQHKNIADADRHEPKGASTAANGTVMHANGDGTTSFHAVDFNLVINKPTTISGYGITNAVSTAVLGQPSGVATLGPDGLVPESQLPAGGSGVTTVFGRSGAVVSQTGDYTFTQIASKPTTLTGYGITDAINVSQKGAINGVASLDSGGLVPTSQLPTFTGAITSVFGRTGVVVAATNDYTFAQIGSKPTTLSGYGITDAKPTGVDNGSTAITVSTYTLVLTDVGKSILSSTVACAVTVPLNSSVAFPIGTTIMIHQMDTFAVSVTAAGGVTLQGSHTATTAQYDLIGLKKIATDTWLVI